MEGGGDDLVWRPHLLTITPAVHREHLSSLGMVLPSAGGMEVYTTGRSTHARTHAPTRPAYLHELCSVWGRRAAFGCGAGPTARRAAASAPTASSTYAWQVRHICPGASHC